MGLTLPNRHIADREVKENFDALALAVGDIGGVPPAAVNAYAGSTAPEGWLLCDGTAVSRTTYSRLFAAISTTYGAGDGSTTFNVPDLRGRAVIGLGTHADVNALNDNDGLSVGSRKVKHRHGTGSLGISIGTYSSNNIGSAGQIMRGNDTGFDTRSLGTTFSGEVGDTTGPLDAPAHIVLNYIIKV